MSTYIEQNLGKDEVLISKSRVHWVTLILRVVVAFIVYKICEWVIALFISFLSLIFKDMPVYVIVNVIVALLVILPPILQMFTTDLAFTNKKVLGKIGIINTKSLDSPLNKINNVSVSSGLGGKIFGYGTIIITTSSGSYLFKGMANANAFKLNLLEQISQFDEDKIKKQAVEMAQAMKS